MRGRLGFIVLVIFGSFCVYCAQNVVGGGNGSGGNGGAGGMVGNANGDTCCTPPDPPAGDVLFDQTFTPTEDDGTCVSPAIEVGAHRVLVVHGELGNLQWSFGGAAGWRPHPSAVTGEIAVLDGHYGKELRFTYGPTAADGPPCPFTRSLTLVGYKQ